MSMIMRLARLANNLDEKGLPHISDEIDRICLAYRKLDHNIDAYKVNEFAKRQGLPPYMLQMMNLSKNSPAANSDLAIVDDDLFERHQPTASGSFMPPSESNDLPETGLVLLKRKMKNLSAIHEMTHADQWIKKEIYPQPSPLDHFEMGFDYIMQDIEMEARVNEIISYIYSHGPSSKETFMKMNDLSADELFSNMTGLLWDEIVKAMMTKDRSGNVIYGNFKNAINKKWRIIEHVKNEVLKMMMKESLGNMDEKQKWEMIQRISNEYDEYDTENKMTAEKIINLMDEDISKNLKFKLSSSSDQMTKEAYKKHDSGVEEYEGNEIAKHALPPEMIQMMGFTRNDPAGKFKNYVVPNEWMEQRKPDTLGYLHKINGDPDLKRQRLEELAEDIGVDELPSEGHIVLKNRNRDLSGIHELTHVGQESDRSSSLWNDIGIGYILSPREMEARFNAIISFIYAKPNATFQQFASQKNKLMNYNDFIEEARVQIHMFLWNHIKNALKSGNLIDVMRDKEQIIDGSKDDFVRGPLVNMAKSLRMFEAVAIRSVLNGYAKQSDEEGEYARFLLEKMETKKDKVDWITPEMKEDIDKWKS